MFGHLSTLFTVWRSSDSRRSFPLSNLRVFLHFSTLHPPVRCASVILLLRPHITVLRLLRHFDVFIRDAYILASIRYPILNKTITSFSDHNSYFLSGTCYNPAPGLCQDGLKEPSYAIWNQAYYRKKTRIILKILAIKISPTIIIVMFILLSESRCCSKVISTFVQNIIKRNKYLFF